MRVRTFRAEDVTTLYQIHLAAAHRDTYQTMDEQVFSDWITDPQLDACSNIFVLTDDDDELQTWGQAGTLEGIEGEIIGYTVVQCFFEADCYHFRCIGAVHPDHRRKGAGNALLICALNRMHGMEAEVDSGAIEQSIYFEVLLPAQDVNLQRLLERRHMQFVSAEMYPGFCLYRQQL
ncbi:MAG TPA: GNAT family N-acetyltransferase [Dictyobacter sp.]|nr:GNAT family N-acetyltransferase [Dictyobacter sp.]